MWFGTLSMVPISPKTFVLDLTLLLQTWLEGLRLTVDPLAPDCTMSCRQFLGKGLCSPAGTQALYCNEITQDCDAAQQDKCLCQCLRVDEIVVVVSLLLDKEV